MQFMDIFGWGENTAKHFRLNTRGSGEWLKNHRSLHYWKWVSKDRKSGHVYAWKDKTDVELIEWLEEYGLEVKEVSLVNRDR